MEDLILVSNWEKAEKDDFYLSDDWTEEAGKEEIAKARKLQKEGNLYLAYIVKALDYALFGQMDADQVFIDRDDNVIIHCESEIIDNKHSHKIEYDCQ